MNIDKRPTTNHIIGIEDITIGINGLPNSNTNKRCENNNQSGDGFVYTYSTTIGNSGEYEYDYNLNKENKKLNDIDKVNGETDIYRYANCIRDAKTSDGKAASESLVNAKQAWNGGQQLDGTTTDKVNFIYNEGSNIGNSNNGDDNHSIYVSDGKGGYELKEGYKEPDLEKHINFYDRWAENYSDQITKIRKL